MPTELLPFLLGAVLGAVIAWLISRPRLAALGVRLAEREREIADLRAAHQTHAADAERRLAELRTERDAVRNDVTTVSQARDRAEAALESERKAFAAQLEASQSGEARLKEAFQALSAESLKTVTHSFMTLAKSEFEKLQQGAQADLEARRVGVDQLVKPIQEQLTKVDSQLRQFDEARIAGQAALQEHLRQLLDGHARLTSETQALVTALRAPQARGQWGELQLRRVVELAGMLEHCDFATQQTVQGDDGALRPDLVVRLPGRKAVVVDSKAPLAAYLEALDASDEQQRGAHLDRHAQQVRRHVEALSSKDYANQFAEAPDFVVLFLPGEAFFSAACQRDPSLIEFAVTRGVIPASPTTLVTLLKAVAYGWQQERIAERAEEIRDLGLELTKRIGIFRDHVVKIRKGLTGAVEAYNGAVGSLEQRILPTVRKIRELADPAGPTLEALEPVDVTPRTPAAPELVAGAATELLELPSGDGEQTAPHD